MEKKKIYQTSWFLWICGIFVTPVGIILLWTIHKNKSNKTKIILTAIFAVWFILLLSASGESNDTTSVIDTNETAYETEVEETTTIETEIEADDTEVASTTAENGIDSEQWPELASLNLSNEIMLEIFNDYEKAWETTPEDPEKIAEYEAEVAKNTAEEYGITPDQADLVYGYVIMNYEKVANGGVDIISEYNIKFGEMISVTTNGSKVVIKAKIDPSWNDDLTIKQNYYNVCDLIKNQGLDIYDEVQYWAVADMTDGNEAKVISFTVTKDTINDIMNEKFPENELGDHVIDLWLISELEK